MEAAGSIEGPVLYKCPYCARGRFRNRNGWKEAIEHIKTHQRRDREQVVQERERPSTGSGMLFDVM